ncbi:MAG: hypothetical protein ACE5EJ_01245 [Nitrosopumilaceae archaeon]
MQAVYIIVMQIEVMGKVLYVRGFDNKLHDKLSDQAKKEGISPASILEEAYEDWINKKAAIPSLHYLLLYSDEKSLLGFLKKVHGMLDENCVRLCAGTPSSALKYLKKHGWIDGTKSSYVQEIKKTPEKTTSKVFDRLAEISGGKYSCYMGFMTEDVALKFSVERANEIERIYNSKRIPGVVFCPYNMAKLKGYSLKDLLELFGEHDKSYIVEGSDVFEINIKNTNLPKLFV